MATGVAGQSPSRLFFIVDQSSQRRFLVDTGAAVSVLPPSEIDRRSPQHRRELQAANGSVIATYGLRSLTLNLGSPPAISMDLHDRRCFTCHSWS